MDAEPLDDGVVLVVGHPIAAPDPGERDLDGDVHVTVLGHRHLVLAEQRRDQVAGPRGGPGVVGEHAEDAGTPQGLDPVDAPRVGRTGVEQLGRVQGDVDVTAFGGDQAVPEPAGGGDDHPEGAGVAVPPGGQPDLDLPAIMPSK